MTGASANRALRIEVLEPYDAVSHRLHWEGLRTHSRHSISISTLPPRLWKFRMRTASFHFASLFSARAAAGESPPDLWVCSEYLSAAEFIPLLPVGWRDVPVVVDFHENQLTYPLQEGESRDLHFAWSHLHSGLVSARSVFHTAYHLDEFLIALPALLRPVPDVDLRALPEQLAARSVVLPLGTEIEPTSPVTSPVDLPVVLWSHRWEYDKGPDAFVEAVETCLARGERFRVRLLGQRFRSVPASLGRLRAMLGDDLLDDGYLPDRAAYLALVREADIFVSTAHHEFFGLSALEAIRAGLLPVLPDDLSYPELLPPRARVFPYLYRRADGCAPALARALAMVRGGEEGGVRESLVAESERFTWREVAPRYDALFSSVVAGE